MSIILNPDICSDRELKIVENGPISIIDVLSSKNSNDIIRILDILQYSLLTEQNYDIQYALFLLLYNHSNQRLHILENNLDLLYTNILNYSLRESIILLIQFHYAVDRILDN